MTFLHIHKPKVFFLGQVRKHGAQTWETVTGKCQSAEGAMSKAVLSMKPTDFRARCIMVDYDGWYAPNVVMECKR